MEIYLLKSTACLALLYSFYKLFLENENMHLFKRFYLLGSLIISFAIPLITFTTYVVRPEIQNTIVFSESNGPVVAESINYVPIIIWTIYGIGMLFFSLKFFRNLRSLFLKIKLNQKVRKYPIINVLLKNVEAPHTFFNYIFLNKQKFENREIPEEVLIHEETHAIQKHSLDILIIELLQILLWFNPFIYLVKRSIKLNHEFLADKAVLEHGVEAASYQNLLLGYSSINSDNILTNAINYSSIKKRFTIMKTETSKRSILLRSILILPLLAILLYSFSTIKQVETSASDSEIAIPIDQEKATKAQVAEYNKLAKKYNDMPADNMFVKKKDVERLKYLYGLMSDKQRSNAQPFPKIPPMPAPPAPPKDGEDNTWVNATDDDMPPPPPIMGKKPVDHIIRMADENALFFFENKEITSEQAVALVKEKKNLHVETTKFSKSNPIMKITKAPKDSNNIWMEEINGDVPPPPPPPKAPLPMEDPTKVISKMAKKGAIFYSNDKKISADEAMKMVREIDLIKIEVKDGESSKPKVYLIGC